MAKQRKRAKKTGADDVPTLKQAAFLAAYAECGSIAHAAKLAGCHRTVHGKWMREDESYRQRFVEAHVDLCDKVEAEIIRRAVDGIEEPVIYKGQLSMTTKPDSRKKVPLAVKKYSDVLLIFLAKGLMREKYRERTSIEHSGEIGGETVLVITEDEGWYGNNAHEKARNQVAEGAPASSAGPNIGSEIQASGVRPALGQDGGWPASDDPGSRTA